jgi:hypothetical protein
MEAAPGFEPGIRALQARALPLGYAASVRGIRARDSLGESVGQQDVPIP